MGVTTTTYMLGKDQKVKILAYTWCHSFLGLPVLLYFTNIKAKIQFLTAKEITWVCYFLSRRNTVCIKLKENMYVFCPISVYWPIRIWDIPYAYYSYGMPTGIWDNTFIPYEYFIYMFYSL